MFKEYNTAFSNVSSEHIPPSSQKQLILECYIHVNIHNIVQSLISLSYRPYVKKNNQIYIHTYDCILVNQNEI